MKKINPHTIHTYINNIHNNIKLNPTYEEHGSIDYLDLTNLRKHTRLEVDIHRKPTTADTTINFLSSHPIEQKTAAYRFHIAHLHSLLLDANKIRIQKEWETIKSIATNNFPQHLLQKTSQWIQNRTNPIHNRKKDNKRIWATFTYHSPQIRKITNLFRSTNIGVAFKATTTLQQLIRPTMQNQKPQYEKLVYI